VSNDSACRTGKHIDNRATNACFNSHLTWVSGALHDSSIEQCSNQDLDSRRNGNTINSHAESTYTALTISITYDERYPCTSSKQLFPKAEFASQS
jgi:hypothetical protein